MANGKRLQVWFQPQDYARLQELQKATAGLSKAKLIHRAVQLLEVVITGRLKGKDLYLVDRQTGERDRVIVS